MSAATVAMGTVTDIDTAPRTFAQTVYADLTSAELAADVMPGTLFPVVVPFGATR